MGKYVYGAIVRPSEDGGFWGEVPDLPGCFGQGDDFMETVESLSDGVETHLATLVEYGMPIPKSKPVSSEDGDIVYISANVGGLKLDISTVSEKTTA